MPEDNETRKSNPRLKAAPMKADNSLQIGIGEKGGIAVYGLQRWPVTLYFQQWERLCAVAQEIIDFGTEHVDLLSDGLPAAVKTMDKTESFKVNAADILLVAAEAEKLAAAGDVKGSIKYATIKGVAEANGGRVPPEAMKDILLLKLGNK